MLMNEETPVAFEPDEVEQCSFERLFKHAFFEEEDRLWLRGVHFDLLTAVVASKIAAQFLAVRHALFYQDETKRASRKKIKPDGSSTVPEDIEAQNIVLSILRKRMRGSDGILAEEGVEEVANKRRVWLVDGLDGTARFAEGSHNFASAVGLVEQGRFLTSAIAHPFDVDYIDVFFGMRNRRAFVHAPATWGTDSHFHRLRVSPFSEISAYRGVTHGHVLAAIQHQCDPDVPLRRYTDREFLRLYGSAALQQAGIASGVFDWYAARNPKPWDAIGTVLITEAGGRVTNFQNEPRDIFSSDSYLATNGHVHGRMVDLFRESL